MDENLLHSRTERLHAVILHPYKFASESVVQFYATDAASLFTEPSETPPNQAFMARMVGGFIVDRAISDSGTLGGGSSIEPGEINLANGDGLLDRWPVDYAWDGRLFEVKIGALTDLSGARLPWAQWETLFQGTIESVFPTNRTTMTIRCRGNRYLQTTELQTNTYEGWDGALRFSGTDSASAPDAAVLDIAQNAALTIKWIGVVDALPTTNDVYIIRKGTNWGLILQPDGFLRFDGVASATSTTVVPVGQKIHIRCELTAAAASAFFIDGVAAGTGGATVGPTNNDNITIADGSGAETFQGTYWELRVWNFAIGSVQAAEFQRQPVPRTATGLAALFKFNEQNGVTFSDDLQNVTFTHTQTVEADVGWISTFTGDDPNERLGSVFGQPKPIMLGKCLNVAPKLVDAGDLAYQFHDPETSAATDLTRVYTGRVPLTFEETVNGRVTVEAASNTVSISGSADNFRRWIPGQSVPPRTGMQFRVAVPGNISGLTIAPEGISADQSTITTVEDITLDAVATNGVVVTEGDAPYQFTLDLAAGAFTLASVALNTITTDAVGWTSSGQYRVSDVVNFVTGLTVDASALVFDPSIGIYITEPILKKDLLDQVMESCWGWWIHDRTGVLKIGNFDRDASVPTSLIAFDENSPLNMEGIPAALPNWRVGVAYQRNWTVQNQELPGSVSADDRQFAAEQYRVVTRSDESVRTQYPNSEELSRFETLLTEKADAETLADRLMRHFGSRREFFSMRVSTPPLSVDLNQFVSVTYPRFNLDNTPMLVTRMQEDSTRNEATMEVMRWL